MLTLTNMTSLFYFFHSTKFVQIPASAVWKIWRKLSGLNLAISRKIWNSVRIRTVPLPGSSRWTASSKLGVQRQPGYPKKQKRIDSLRNATWKQRIHQRYVYLLFVIRLGNWEPWLLINSNAGSLTPLPRRWWASQMDRPLSVVDLSTILRK